MLPYSSAAPPQRAPLLLSTAALALSCAALLVSLSNSSNNNGDGNAIKTEPPNKWHRTGAAASSSPHQVTINGLTIAGSEIDAGTVGTRELTDGSITSDKLADGAVTASALNPDAVALIARKVSHSRYLAGEVDEAGTAVIGTRFTSERTGTGEYVVHFTEPFPSPPVVVASAQSYGSCYAPTQTLDAASVRIKCMSDLLGSAPHPANTRFSFYAAPPL